MNFVRTPPQDFDDEPHRLSWNRAPTALLISMALHAVIMLVMSLMVLSSVSEINPVLTAFIDPGDGAEEFDETPQLTVQAPETVDVEVSTPIVPEVSEIQETSISLFTADAESDNSTEANNTTSGGAQGGGAQADPTVVARIQGRVDRAGGKKGEVQFSLIWANTNDLDLHVVTPSGERISFDHKNSACRGALDVDMNVTGESEEPVENVRWLDRRAPSGRYTVLINLYRTHGRGITTDYQLLANLGAESEISDAAVSSRQTVGIHRFYYAPASVTGNRRRLYLAQLKRQQESDERRAEVMLDRADKVNRDLRDRRLMEIVEKYPHTDAAVEALKKMSGSSGKN